MIHQTVGRDVVRGVIPNLTLGFSSEAIKITASSDFLTMLTFS